VAVITTAEFKTYRGITVSTWDTLIGNLNAAAQARAERFCGRSFDQTTYTEKHNGGASVVMLRNLPVASITSVAITTADGSSSTVASTSYTFNANTGELRLANDEFGFDFDAPEGAARYSWGWKPRFPRGLQNVTVVYVGGYSTAPADLKQVLYEMVDEMFSPIYTGQGDSKQYQSESLGQYSYSRKSADETLRLFADRLRPFRRARA
jgi:hypothetical protein